MSRPPAALPPSQPQPVQLLVIAKAPVPGRVKTRLCPPCTPEQAAELAGAALADTLAVATATAAMGRTLVLDGSYRPPPGWAVADQSDGTLGERLAEAFAVTARPGVSSLLVGADTPQLTAAVLDAAARELDTVDAVLGPAVDGGWWALGLRNPAAGAALRTVATSTPRTGADTLAALRASGLRVALLPTVRDVDTAVDARVVAALCPPDGRFASTVGRLLPEPVAR